jgi:hypothetical protein
LAECPGPNTGGTETQETGREEAPNQHFDRRREADTGEQAIAGEGGSVEAGSGEAHSEGGAR